MKNSYSYDLLMHSTVTMTYTEFLLKNCRLEKKSCLRKKNINISAVNLKLYSGLSQ